MFNYCVLAKDLKPKSLLLTAAVSNFSTLEKSIKTNEIIDPKQSYPIRFEPILETIQIRYYEAIFLFKVFANK